MTLFSDGYFCSFSLQEHVLFQLGLYVPYSQKYQILHLNIAYTFVVKCDILYVLCFVCMCYVHFVKTEMLKSF